MTASRNYRSGRSGFYIFARFLLQLNPVLGTRRLRGSPQPLISSSMSVGGATAASRLLSLWIPSAPVPATVVTAVHWLGSRYATPGMHHSRRCPHEQLFRQARLLTPSAADRNGPVHFRCDEAVADSHDVAVRDPATGSSHRGGHRPQFQWNTCRSSPHNSCRSSPRSCDAGHTNKNSKDLALPLISTKFIAQPHPYLGRVARVQLRHPLST